MGLLRCFLVGLALISSVQTQAEGLRRLEGERLPEVTCENLVAEFQAYLDLARENEVAVSGFVTQIGGKMSGWYYDLLLPLEGRQVDVAPGQFLVVKQGADQVYGTLDAMYENSDFLDRRREAILRRLSKCLK